MQPAALGPSVTRRAKYLARAKKHSAASFWPVASILSVFKKRAPESTNSFRWIVSHFEIASFSIVAATLIFSTKWIVLVSFCCPPLSYFTLCMTYFALVWFCFLYCLATIICVFVLVIFGLIYLGLGLSYFRPKIKHTSFMSNF